MTPAPERDAAQVIANLVKSHAGLDLPVRLRLWDGSEAGPAGGPVLVIRSPRALQRIGWRPGELGLARAYISGDLEVEGDLTEGLRQVLGTRPRVSPARLGPRRPGRDKGRVPAADTRVAPATPAGLRAARPRPPALPGPGPGGDRRPLRPDRRVLPAHPGSQHGLLLRLVGRRGSVADQPGPGRRAAGQAGADLRQAEPPARRPAAGPGLRLGLAHRARRPRPPGPGHRRDPVPRAGRLRPPARPRAGPDRPGRGQDPGLPGHRRRPLRRHRLGRDGRARRRGRLPGVLRRAVPPAAPGRPAAHPADVPRSAAPRAAGRSSSPTSPRTCTCARSGRPSG